MKKKWILLIIALLVILVGIGIGSISCSGEKVTGSNQASGESFSMVVSMGGKELTIGAPVVSPGNYEKSIVTVTVKNSGKKAISLAEIELVYWVQCLNQSANQYWDREFTDQVQVKNLVPGEVRTIYWGETLAEIETGEKQWIPFLWECKGSLRIKVTKIE